MKAKKEKIIGAVCFSCGKKYDRKNKLVMGAWIGDCTICGEKGVTVADGPHDFGIYSNKEIEAWDKEQDKI